MKRIIAGALAVLICGAAAGCGSSDAGSSAESDTASQAVSEAAEAPAAGAVKEADFMSSFLGGDGKNYLGMSLADLNADTGNAFDEQNALDFDKDFGQATYDLGQLDSLLCGRASFGGSLPVTLTICFDGDRITKFLYKIDEGAVDSAAVCKSIAEVLKNGLPADYNGEYDYKSAGKDSARFANDVNGYVFEVKHFSLDDTGYPVYFTLESYKDKYGQ